MRPFLSLEIDEVVASLGICLGKQLQTVVTNESEVVLGLWEGRHAIWLWLDLNPNEPALIPMMELPVTPANKKSPLQLFLKAHFVGRVLERAERREELGRVVRLHFNGDAHLEFRMIPRGVNLIAKAEGKQVSFKPVKQLPSSAEVSPSSKMRNLRELIEEWKATRFTKREVKSPKANLEKRLQSLNRSLEKVLAEVDSKKHSPWRQLGNWLLENQTLEVPAEFSAWIDRRRKLAWNIEECFRKAKEAERKLEGTEARVEQLKQDIASLEKRMAQGDWLEPEKKRHVRDERPSARTLHLADNFTVVAGKSAKDNLDLLRKAHAWDLWLHVKDQPSAHAILFRPKGAKISDDMLRKASQWLLKMSLGAKFKNHVGEKFEILSAECRFVSPIRGDRLGRVTYRNEKVLITKFEG